MAENTGLMIAPLQWSELKDIEEVDPLNESDSECLVELREVLKKHGKRDRFGVALLHSHFKMAEDEVLMEYTDKEERTLTLAPIKQAEVSNAVGTIWKLLDGEIQSATFCHSYCQRRIWEHNQKHVKRKA